MVKIVVLKGHTSSLHGLIYRLKKSFFQSGDSREINGNLRQIMQVIHRRFVAYL
jgi:hypothetical protein